MSFKCSSGFDPNVWGPHAWIFLDTIALAYPIFPNADDKLKYKTFFTNVGSILPCSCRKNYPSHLDNTPLTDEVLSSNETFVKWWLQIHNMVRKSQNKKEIKYDEFNTYYKNLYKSKANKFYIYLIVSIIITCILFYLLNKLFK